MFEQYAVVSSGYSLREHEMFKKFTLFKIIREVDPGWNLGELHVFYEFPIRQFILLFILTYCFHSMYDTNSFRASSVIP